MAFSWPFTCHCILLVWGVCFLLDELIEKLTSILLEESESLFENLSVSMDAHFLEMLLTSFCWDFGVIVLISEGVTINCRKIWTHVKSSLNNPFYDCAMKVWLYLPVIERGPETLFIFSYYETFLRLCNEGMIIPYCYRKGSWDLGCSSHHMSTYHDCLLISRSRDVFIWWTPGT